jgi:hypothetical protein
MKIQLLQKFKVIDGDQILYLLVLIKKSKHFYDFVMKMEILFIIYNKINVPGITVILLMYLFYVMHFFLFLAKS